ncbi:O-acetyl-ADP-ribose deacetylase [Candidatus Poribacteria bacterium]|nr:O-acetyl-ADP-ribose deacetylase [Candidatus Poribacteria bacterium]
MAYSVDINNKKLTLIKGDITQQDTDAIVNAANSSLMGGGGVDGAIHRAGGPKILEECKEIRKNHGICKTGEAVITSGGNLKARYVIHTVGPVWHGGNNNEPELLAKCYKNSLKLAVENNIKTISFPSISTGAYGYSIEKAAPVALNTVMEFLSENDSLTEVVFTLFSSLDYEIYKETLENILSGRNRK